MYIKANDEIRVTREFGRFIQHRVAIWGSLKKKKSISRVFDLLTQLDPSVAYDESLAKSVKVMTLPINIKRKKA